MSAALGVVASTLSIALVWPQVWLSCRHGRTLGMSPTSTWLAVALNFCWLTFGLLTGDPAQIVTNTVVGAANTALLLALLLTQPQLRSRRALARTASGALCLVAFAAGSAAFVVLLGADPAALAGPLVATASLVGAAACLPQPLSLLRDRTQDVSGLSPARWILGAGSCAAWMGYGLSLGQTEVWLSAAVGLVCALVVCGVLFRPAGQVAQVVELGRRVPARLSAVAA
ncbi:SemiSWEET transporter [Blastococcus sp. LR1]|uniref:SemiSWEET transporter n=1 Tax=Blastococcus sp. LR1 TaxID=2877000 RepID=UPI001CCE6435|nr:SemiSWEET transporter [Blastococcus sp. LR1]MCA0146673.1 SemiSWEET transporter [Blastococcus sp. LR1]